ncbi:hypothetical protein GOODEAATRI_015517 [Goodea atripinnis]|uniref:Uncharacterized protein n=1 Tax=Goodea atripinnis TaxID=208336 RepID=A0ABV0MSA1_9TELE
MQSASPFLYVSVVYRCSPFAFKVTFGKLRCLAIAPFMCMKVTSSYGKNKRKYGTGRSFWSGLHQAAVIKPPKLELSETQRVIKLLGGNQWKNTKSEDNGTVSVLP